MLWSKLRSKPTAAAVQYIQMHHWILMERGLMHVGGSSRWHITASCKLCDYSTGHSFFPWHTKSRLQQLFPIPSHCGTAQVQGHILHVRVPGHYLLGCIVVQLSHSDTRAKTLSSFLYSLYHMIAKMHCSLQTIPNLFPCHHNFSTKHARRLSTCPLLLRRRTTRWSSNSTTP